MLISWVHSCDKRHRKKGQKGWWHVVKSSEPWWCEESWIIRWIIARWLYRHPHPARTHHGGYFNDFHMESRDLKIHKGAGDETQCGSKIPWFRRRIYRFLFGGARETFNTKWNFTAEPNVKKEKESVKMSFAAHVCRFRWMQFRYKPKVMPMNFAMRNCITSPSRVYGVVESCEISPAPSEHVHVAKSFAASSPWRRKIFHVKQITFLHNFSLSWTHNPTLSRLSTIFFYPTQPFTHTHSAERRRHFGPADFQIRPTLWRFHGGWLKSRVIELRRDMRANDSCSSLTHPVSQAERGDDEKYVSMSRVMKKLIKRCWFNKLAGRWDDGEFIVAQRSTWSAQSPLNHNEAP